MEHKISFVGKRTIKTALAVFLCLLVDTFFFHTGGIYSCVTAIICMMPTVGETLEISANRVLATVLSCVAGLLVLVVYTWQPDAHRVIRLFLVPFFVIILISACLLLKRKGSVVLCCSIFIILASGPVMTLPIAIIYVVKRFFETILGIAIAFAVNRLIFPLKADAEGENKSDHAHY